MITQLPPLPSHKGFAGRTVVVCPAPDGIRVYRDDRLLLEQAADPWAGPVRALDMQRSRAPDSVQPSRRECVKSPGNWGQSPQLPGVTLSLTR